DSRVNYENITSFSTRRRLAVMLHIVDESQNTITTGVRGPAMKIAKEDLGDWSQASIGYTKGQGMSDEDIYTREVNGVECILVEKTIEGKQTKENIPESKDIINSLHCQQTMRWGELSYKFARPIRWLVALADEEVIPFEIAEVKTDRETRGHR